MNMNNIALQSNILKRFTTYQLKLLQEEADIGDEWKELVTLAMEPEGNLDLQTENYRMIATDSIPDIIHDMIRSDNSLLSMVWANALADALNVSLETATALQEIDNDYDLDVLLKNSEGGYEGLVEIIMETDGHLFMLGSYDDNYIDIDGITDWTLMRV